MSIADETYVSVTTYTADGTAKSTPVWIADFGNGKVGFTTASSSYKVKRLANDTRVALQPSDAKGVVREGTEQVTGTAEVCKGSAFRPYETIVRNKYGMQYRAIKLLGKFMKLIGKGSGTDTAITLDEPVATTN